MACNQIFDLFMQSAHTASISCKRLDARASKTAFQAGAWERDIPSVIKFRKNCCSGRSCRNPDVTPPCGLDTGSPCRYDSFTPSIGHPKIAERKLLYVVNQCDSL